MSDSEDDLSTPANIPPDSEIEQCLRRVTRAALKNDEDVTINSARSRAEKELELDEGFFKDTAAWKNRSKDIVKAEADEADRLKNQPAPKAGTKRKSDEAPVQSKKRARKPTPTETEGAGKRSAKTSKAAATKAKQADVPSDTGSSLSDLPESDLGGVAKQDEKSREEEEESDYSIVNDDPPPKQKRQKKSTSPAAKKSQPKKQSKPDKAKSSTADKGKELSPDEEEIKRLQSWLLKCGVRKLWHRELAPYDSAKDKIRHLKRMLDDVGMTGRFSAEKAKQIKEARELKDELEAAREFNEKWGDGAGSGSDEDEGRDRKAKQAAVAPQRRLKPKGLIDLSDDDDGDSD
ncbi:hypothetical protein BDY17DRAFT_12615 [Neohortaea acidophila]|uniref:Transcriptional regulator n=1 Tax=Neohortaea acidophila TaxID=245834 RepID=A0A6A6Q4Y9_9PEZI|nr:uncharacterized protein BDY17DRAFT_12615 [Neohortaea acidophila]KAF2487508.1 hypothetical protein BDY17DRAFT_12615 [Neohortaea acidophila]